MSGAVFDLRVAEGNGDAVLWVRGEIDLANADELYDAVHDGAGLTGALAIDLRELSYIDSAGLAALHRAYRELGEGRELTVIVPPDAPCARTFDVAALDLPIRPS